MENSEIVQKWAASTANGDWETFDALTSEDFVLVGPGPEPLNKQAYLGWIQSVIQANPDHKNNVALGPVSKDVFKGTVQMQGTHTEDWDLSFMNLGIIPATGKAWINPKETLTITVGNGQVVKCEVEVPEDGGIGGIMSQLGVQMPGK